MVTVGTHRAALVPRRLVCLDSQLKRRLLNDQGVVPTVHNAGASLNPETGETLVPEAEGCAEDIHRAMHRLSKSGAGHLSRSRYYC